MNSTEIIMLPPVPLPKFPKRFRLPSEGARHGNCGLLFVDASGSQCGTRDDAEPANKRFRYAIAGSAQGRRAVTGRQEDHGAFRTPQLREIGRTAPYMHDGRFETLEQVIQHYNFGGVTDDENEYRDEKLEVLYLSEKDVQKLVEFLKSGLTTPE